MTRPATDKAIEEIADTLAVNPSSRGNWHDIVIASLIARIHAETEARKAAEELARSIRYNTIQECAALAHAGPVPHYMSISTANNIERAILALLEKKP